VCISCVLAAINKGELRKRTADGLGGLIERYKTLAGHRGSRRRRTVVGGGTVRVVITTYVSRSTTCSQLTLSH